MALDLVVRPLELADAPAVDAVAWQALQAYIPAEVRPDPSGESVRARRGRTRVAHLLATDPEGCWVAERDGAIVATALSLVREGVWGLSLFAVAPGLQGQGIGGRTLEGALRYGEGRRGRIILSSADPRAMRRYARAGLRVKPALAAAGAANRRRLPAGLRSRPADVADARDRLDALSRRVRGATHGPDFDALVATDCGLLTAGDRGYALHRDGSPVLLAAADDEAAADLLWSCLATAQPGASVHVDFITEGNDWAVAVALDAGLSLTPEGPVFVDGETGPFAPYLPSGSFL